MPLALSDKLTGLRRPSGWVATFMTLDTRVPVTALRAVERTCQLSTRGVMVVPALMVKLLTPSMS